MTGPAAPDPQNVTDEERFRSRNRTEAFFFARAWRRTALQDWNPLAAFASLFCAPGGA